MSDFAKKWGDEFNKCVQPLQGKGSPRTAETIEVAKGSAPLLKALIGVDKNDSSTLKAGKERETMHKALGQEVKSFKSEAAKYGKLIDAAVKKTSKDEKDAYRALKKLRAHLDNVDAMIEHHWVSNSKANNQAVLAVTGNNRLPFTATIDGVFPRIKAIVGLLLFLAVTFRTVLSKYRSNILVIINHLIGRCR